MMGQNLRQFFCEYCGMKPELVQDESSMPYSQCFAKLRDQLMMSGTVLYENEEEQISVVNIKSGILNMADAYFAVRLRDGYLEICSYAEEGIIFQNIRKRALEMLSEVVCDECSEQ